MLQALGCPPIRTAAFLAGDDDEVVPGKKKGNANPDVDRMIFRPSAYLSRRGLDLARAIRTFLVDRTAMRLSCDFNRPTQRLGTLSYRQLATTNLERLIWWVALEH